MKPKLLFLLCLGTLFFNSLFAHFDGDLVEGEWYNPEQPFYIMDGSTYCNDRPFCWQDWLNPYLRHVEGRGFGYECGYTTLGVFVLPRSYKPFNVQPYIDVRGHCFDTSKTALNVGIGGRYICSSIERVVGLGLYYDYRQVHRSDLNQLGLSLEVLGCKYDIRANGYLVVGRKRVYGRKSSLLYNLEGHLAEVREYRRGLSGIDGEISTNLRKWLPCSIVDVYAGIGPYWYRGDFKKNITGGRFRIGIEYQYVTLEARVTYDDSFETIVQGLLSLVIPFTYGDWTCYKSCHEPHCLCIEDVLAQPVYRQEIISASRKEHWWDTNF